MSLYPSLLNPLVAACLEARSAGRGITRRMGGRSFRVSAKLRWIVSDEYEPEARAFIEEHISSHEEVLDVGSHVGVYVLWFASCSPGAVIHAFEPNPQTRAFLERHVRLNGLTERVTIQPWAVCDREGVAPFAALPCEGMSRLGSENPLLKSRTRSIQVRTINLDQYCQTRSLHPTWLRIDVEGYEIAVLRGASQVIQQGKGRLKLVVEMHPAAWPSSHTTRDEAEQFLRDHGLSAVPLTGQVDPLKDYGIVSLEYL